MTPPVALTIAGSDSGAGAGVQADLKVFSALGVYAASVVTAVTAQNTRGVQDVFPMPGTVVAMQLGAVLEDLPPAATKVGMLATAEAAAAVAARARAGALPNLVLDPVLQSSSGRRLGVVTAIERLLPYATVVTPNREEASALVGWQVGTPADMAGAAAQLAAGGPPYVVVTGGDLVTGEEVVDAVWSSAGAKLVGHPRVATRNTHGTGCTFSAAIAARLALGDAVPDAITFARQYVVRALLGARAWTIGAGHGPLDHLGWSG
ncbi:MAG TPA: bifunctional hydroxymethylpyrimidine kinase/phosphomethylpyrimidine kinase [Pilimelia sp.]|nr:bifunctional hydroxymethylpyrimidine kinase/phosphomethylpyrimidine kinase [Pilimelia sp.]